MRDKPAAEPAAGPKADSEGVLRATLDTTRDRNAADLAARLSLWLDLKFPGARVTSVNSPEQSGASSELYFLTLTDTNIHGRAVHEAVLRLSPAYPVYPIVDLQMKFRCMDIVRRRSSAPVPVVYLCETDAEVLGAPFLMMERRRGRGAPDWPSYVREGWIHDLNRDDQERLWRNGIEAVAAVHRTDLRGEDCHGLTLAVPGASPLDRMLVYWRRYLEFVSQGGEYPQLEQAVAWLERERPDLEFEPRMVWGDASLRNMLFEGLHPCALLDFEFAHVGIAPFDIAFYALMDYVMAEGFAAGSPRLAGFVGIQRTLDVYESITGWPVPAREYFVRMAAAYMSLATTRVFQRLAREGRVPAETVSSNPPLLILGKIMESGRLPE